MHKSRELFFKDKFRFKKTKNKKLKKSDNSLLKISNKKVIFTLS